MIQWLIGSFNLEEKEGKGATSTSLITPWAAFRFLVVRGTWLLPMWPVSPEDACQPTNIAQVSSVRLVGFYRLVGQSQSISESTVDVDSHRTSPTGEHGWYGRSMPIHLVLPENTVKSISTVNSIHSTKKSVDFNRPCGFIQKKLIDSQNTIEANIYSLWPHVQAWLSRSERWTVNPQVVGLIPSKTRKLKFP